MSPLVRCTRLHDSFSDVFHILPDTILFTKRYEFQFHALFSTTLNSLMVAKLMLRCIIRNALRYLRNYGQSQVYPRSNEAMWQFFETFVDQKIELYVLLMDKCSS